MVTGVSGMEDLTASSAIRRCDDRSFP